MSPGPLQPIIVKKKKAGHGGHHGGAWKVAYADFVTAMMAFFLVMWLVGQSKPVKSAVAGYFLSNDVSERVFQIERAGQWTKGKGCETFGPIGPWMVTKDEIKDPQNLNIWLKVNGEYRQRGNTKTMVFGVAEIVWWCSQYFIMEPGDIIVTGTPSGVALGMKPPKFLNVGDVVEPGCDGLGTQKQKVVKARA